MMIKLGEDCPLDLNATLGCGQAFRWNKTGRWWVGVVEKKVIRIRQEQNALEFFGADTETVKQYLGLDENLPEILSQLNKDKNINSAIKAFAGLRILRQDPGECLISYICATYKNVQAIKHMIANLSERFGERMAFEGSHYFVFPTMEKFADAKVTYLAECGLGYRSEYVSSTARTIRDDGIGLDRLGRMSYEKAKEELLCFAGVGLKVADCVLLFSLGKSEAFPIDVQVKRALLRYYVSQFPEDFVRRISCKRSLTNAEYNVLNSFGRTYFGKYAGYAQEYMYHYERTQV